MLDRCQLLKQINRVSFVVNDLNLYLDTYSLDPEALDTPSQVMAQRKRLPNIFAKEYEPLALNCACSETNNKTESKTKYPDQKHFTWSDGPPPWDNQGGAV